MSPFPARRERHPPGEQPDVHDEEQADHPVQAPTHAACKPHRLSRNTQLHETAPRQSGVQAPTRPLTKIRGDLAPKDCSSLNQAAAIPRRGKHKHFCLREISPECWSQRGRHHEVARHQPNLLQTIPTLCERFAATGEGSRGVADAKSVPRQPFRASFFLLVIPYTVPSVRLPASSPKEHCLSPPLHALNPTLHYTPDFAWQLSAFSTQSIKRAKLAVASKSTTLSPMLITISPVVLKSVTQVKTVSQQKSFEHSTNLEHTRVSPRGARANCSGLSRNLTCKMFLHFLLVLGEVLTVLPVPAG